MRWIPNPYKPQAEHCRRIAKLPRTRPTSRYRCMVCQQVFNAAASNAKTCGTACRKRRWKLARLNEEMTKRHDFMVDG